MAKGSGLNVAEQERRKQKAKEIKKVKEQRNKEKLEKLKQADPQRLLKRLNDLLLKKEQNNGRLIYNEQKLLDNLQKDIELIKKHKLDNGAFTSLPNTNVTSEEQGKEEKEDKQTQKQDDSQLGKKSIFYDPEWNPLGIAPEGMQNIEYPLKSPFNHESDESIKNIPLPSSPPPKFFKHDLVKTVYEKQSYDQPVTTHITTSTKFIPSTIRQKQLLTVQDKDEKQEERADEDIDEEFGEYASEEEEALKGIKRKHEEI